MVRKWECKRVKPRKGSNGGEGMPAERKGRTDTVVPSLLVCNFSNPEGFFAFHRLK